MAKVGNVMVDWLYSSFDLGDFMPVLCVVSMIFVLFFIVLEWLFVNRTVNDLLWGYTDPLLADIGDFLHKYLNVSDPEAIIPSFIQLESNNTIIKTQFSRVLSGKVGGDEDFVLVLVLICSCSCSCCSYLFFFILFLRSFLLPF